jgi:hypothetical protein
VSVLSATNVEFKSSTSLVTILEAMREQALFARWFRDPKTWVFWCVFLASLFGLPLDADQLEVFKQCTGRAAAFAGGFNEAWLIVGRRGGKSIILALIAIFLAVFKDWSNRLIPGERGTVLVIAADRRQARVIFRYVTALITETPLIASLVDGDVTQDRIDLTNGISIEISTANFRSVRGYTLIACLCDEIAFWMGDDSANPDAEILAAIRPAMTTMLPDAMLLCASSPYAKRGALYDAFRKYFGQAEAPVLVWKASTTTMNPSVPPSVISEAYERDPANAAAEYGAEFRSDIEAFVTREAVEACVIKGRFELPPTKGISYVGFVDPSGGSADSVTLAIAHREGDRAVLDAVREAKPPFSPEQVTAEFAVLLKTYGIKKVVGDKYAGLWPRERFEVHGIVYEPSAKPKSDLYSELLPLINGARVELLDHPKLVTQICSLERRTARSGKDSIDALGHEDIANACAGAVTGLILQDWSGGAAFFELMRREKAEQARVTPSGGHPPGKPEFEKPQWAKGSVEWQREQAGEVVPHAPREKPPVHISSAANSFDSDWDEKIRSVGLIG